MTNVHNVHPVFATVLFCLLGLSASAFAGDWPAYQHDNQRSGVTDETLKPPFREAWRYRSLESPQPAWPDPAKVDFAASATQPLRPRTAYDRAFHTVIAGDTVYFGSSADDRIVAFDAATGAERWSFFTEGPVRLAPAIYEGKVYAGSDDGYVYCLNAADGALVWKYAPAAAKRLIPGNGRLIASCPVRTGVVVKDGVVYVGVGLFPNEGVYLCALDTATGAERWKQSPDPAEFINQFSSVRVARRFGLSPQGYLLASEGRLYVPTGRTSPVVADLATGHLETLLECPVGEGGTYALVTPDTVVSGPGTQLRTFDAATHEQVASFPGRLIVVQGDISYLLFDDKIAALDRAKYAEAVTRSKTLGARRKELADRLATLHKADRPKEEIQPIEEELKQAEAALKELDGAAYVWTAPCPESYAMIVTGSAVFTGAENAVCARDASTGKRLWSGEVQGKAYGLAAADGRLFASTDAGVIHCFESGGDAPVTEAGPMRVAEPYPQDDLTGTYAAAAQYIVEKTGITQGYCLDLGCGTGRLAFEIARRTELKVVAVDDDSGNIAALRAALAKTGLYGTRVSAFSMPLKTFPFTDYVANLIISDQTLSSGKPPCAPKEVGRLLRPYGGTVCVRYSPDTSSNAKAWAQALSKLGCEIIEDNEGWLMLRRGPLPGAGEWTHQYATPGNTACTEDQLIRSPARLQWFGLPGPRPMVDRHHRANPPLVKDGRLFVPGDNCVIAADAYNGTPLWQVEAPGSRRLASPRDAGNMAAVADRVYVAVQDACWALDAATGRRVAAFAVPQKVQGEKRHWGYVGGVDDLLFGSGQKAGATYTIMNTFGDYEIQWGDFKRVVTSDYLFCLDRETGRERWVYQDGIIIHPTIAVADGRIYFVESHSAKAKEDKGGRITLETLWAGAPSGGERNPAVLVALDMRSGDKIWEKPVDFSLCQHIIYLSCAENILLAVGSGNRDGKAWYYLYAFDASTGAPLWQADHPNNKGGVGGDHGEQIHHPVIIGGIVYAEPVAYLLKTGVRVNPAGEPAQWTLDRRESCGTLSGSASCLFYRDGQPCIHDLGPGGARRKLNWVTRPGCWINMIPADGLILIPEASSGCSCPYPLQTSLAYIPSKP